MTKTLYVQVKRGEEWRKVTTVAVEHRKFDPDSAKSRAAAYVEATRQLTAWQSYDGFAGLPLRIAEEVGYDRYVEARP
ncbi:hypothetical protein [Mesorhizobium sp. 128a]